MTEAIPFSAVSDKEFVAIDGLSIGVGPYWIGEIVTRGTKLRSRFYILKDRLEMREKSRSACLNTGQDPSLPSRILMWKAEVYNIIKTGSTPTLGAGTEAESAEANGEQGLVAKIKQEEKEPVVGSIQAHMTMSTY
ncbi:MAG: hypothetical protein Q9175_005371 [Cornicularia normoerica]